MHLEPQPPRQTLKQKSTSFRCQSVKYRILFDVEAEVLNAVDEDNERDAQDKRLPLEAADVVHNPLHVLRERVGTGCLNARNELELRGGWEICLSGREGFLLIIRP